MMAMKKDSREMQKDEERERERCAGTWVSYIKGRVTASRASTLE